MLLDRLLGKKEKSTKFNYPLAIKRNSRKDEMSEQVKKLLTKEDQKIILMVR